MPSFIACLFPFLCLVSLHFAFPRSLLFLLSIFIHFPFLFPGSSPSSDHFAGNSHSTRRRREGAGGRRAGGGGGGGREDAARPTGSDGQRGWAEGRACEGGDQERADEGVSVREGVCVGACLACEGRRVSEEMGVGVGG